MPTEASTGSVQPDAVQRDSGSPESVQRESVQPESDRSSGSWRAALAGYLHPSANLQTPAHTPLALQFELREIVPRTAQRWNGPPTRAVKPGTRSGDGDFRLGVRPVVRTTRGWARGNLTWSNIAHMANRLALEPGQHRWFCQFVAIHRAGGPINPGNDSDWVLLDEFVNPVLWQLLEQAAALGISFVTPGSGAQVRVTAGAVLTLDIESTEAGLSLNPRLMVDGLPTDLSKSRAIDRHGVYTFELESPMNLVLASTENHFSAEELAIFRGGAGFPALAVPQAEVPEFLDRFLPGLREQFVVDSADGSLVLPPPPLPILVLTATFGARHTSDLRWHWEYRRRSKVPPDLDGVLPLGILPSDWYPEAGAGPTSTPLAATLRGIDAAEFAAKKLPRLRALRGIRVETVGVEPDYQELTGTPLLTVTTIPTEKDDWFNLGIVVTVDGRTIPFTPLFRALARGRRKLLLVDGSYLSLAHPAFAPLADLINEARDLDEWETGPLINKYQTSLWSDFEDLADVSIPAVEWRALLTDVRAEAPVPIAPPAGLVPHLRPYQQDGLDWLAFLWRHQLGGVLADDMGLGKTLQCLALVQYIHETDGISGKPFLVVAPTSVVPNWLAEAAHFAPDLVVRGITSTEAAGEFSISELAAGADIMITSYTLLRLDFQAYQAVPWAALILDEAQFVKNPASKVHECALELPVRFKLAVTGTPMENSLAELHALFAVVAPGLFPSARRFAEKYARPIENRPVGISKGHGAGESPKVIAQVRADRLAMLRRRIRPFMLRRNKDLVAADLPAKQEQTLTIELADEHRDLYDLFLQRERQKLLGLLKDLDRNRFVVFRSLTLLRLLALDASLLDAKYSRVPSSKLDALFEQLEEVIAEGHRALIFSQFTSYLNKAASRLTRAGIEYSYLDGSTRKRGEVIEEFKSGSAPVFLISLKAGGFGINLTEADYVFILDPWWNPASENQAVDRTHRIGQHKNVMVYRMIAADTIEEKVMQLKERKSALFDAVIDDEDLFSAALTADDIRELLD